MPAAAKQRTASCSSAARPSKVNSELGVEGPPLCDLEHPDRSRASKTENEELNPEDQAVWGYVPEDGYRHCGQEKHDGLQRTLG